MCLSTRQSRTANCVHVGPCGSNSALMGMAVLWLFAVPMGLIWFVGHRLYAAKERGELHFERPEEAGSWSHYFDHIRCAEGESRLLRLRMLHRKA